MLKIFKKELFIYLQDFLKHLRKKSQRTKISRAKITYYILSHLFYASSLSLQNYLDESY